MNSDKKKQGLRDFNVASTAICSVGAQGNNLSYFGYDVNTLATQACFDEVAFLLLYSELPDQEALRAFKQRLKKHRNLPDQLKKILRLLPANAKAMDVIRMTCDCLACLTAENSGIKIEHQAEQLLSQMPAALAYWYWYKKNGCQIETQTGQDTIAAHNLSLLLGKPASQLQNKAFDVSMILYAEHELNASTFTARVCASTLADYHAAISAAIASLSGPLHGGANEAALALILSSDSESTAEKAIKQMLQNKQKIMGFGHAVYKQFDPRSEVIKSWARQLALISNQQTLFLMAEKIESVMKTEKRLFPNLDYYSALCYYLLGISAQLYTSLFAFSRLCGWSAHIIEQRRHNVLIRPSASYIGLESRKFKPLSQRNHEALKV